MVLWKVTHFRFLSVLNRLYPVSYTHLDVYKRQAYSYPNTEIIITAKRCGNSVQINFENHGRTIEPEQISGIFEKFNRLDEARLSDTGGAGLGLSIAEEIIRLHGGTITAFSENEMVSFVIMLPISD